MWFRKSNFVSQGCIYRGNIFMAGDIGQVNKGAISNYIEENFVSVVNSEKAGKHMESNPSRFAIMKTNLKFGVHHPVLRVGNSM